MYFDRFF